MFSMKQMLRVNFVGLLGHVVLINLEGRQHMLSIIYHEHMINLEVRKYENWQIIFFWKVIFLILFSRNSNSSLPLSGSPEN